MRNTKELQMTISSREVAEMMEVNHKDLLKKNYINMSAIAFNKLLVEKGILKECTRKTSNGGNKKFKMLVDTEWGENLVNPKCPKETQPMYYQDKFCELLKIVL